MYERAQMVRGSAGLGQDYGTVPGQTYQADVPTTRMPEVAAEMERLQKAVESVGMTAETLVSRLSPVRSQCGNGALKDGGVAPEPVLCGMASALRVQRQRLEAVQNDMQRALAELEI